MADITHGTWIKDGKAVDAVYQNGVKAYGRNLLRDSANQLSNDWCDKNSSWTSDMGTYLGSRPKKVTSAWDNIRYAFSSLAPLINTTDTYTYSVYVKVVGADPSTLSDSLTWLSSATSAENQWTGLNTLSGNDWQRISKTFTFTTNVVNLSDIHGQSIRFELVSNLPDGVFISFAAPKLERGTISTSYSQAPEDILK